MKNRFINALKQLSGGSLIRFPIWATVLLLLVGISLVLMIPLYPLWALMLIGLPISVTFKSYAGSLMLILFYLWIRSLSQKPQPPQHPFQ